MYFSAEIHDSHQLEFQSIIESRAEQAQELELFILAPARYLGDYNRTEFYQDYHSVLRFTNVRRRSYLRSLRELSDQLRANAFDHVAQRKISSPLCHALLLFASRLSTQVKKLRHIELPYNQKEFETLIEYIHLELRWYRDNFVKDLGYSSINVPPQVSECVGNIDEYISTMLFWDVGKIIKSLESFETAQELKLSLQKLLREESLYRESFRSVPRGTIFSKQRFLARYSSLKKTIDAPLFIEEIRFAQDKFYRNIFAAIGASIAAIWSLLADAQTYRLARSEDFGMRASLITLLVVVAYVFKDRIKENSRDFLNARMNSKLPDYRNKVEYKTGTSTNYVLGQTTEWFSRIKQKSLPPELFRLHALNAPQDPLLPDSVVALHFKKRYEMNEMKTVQGVPSSSLKEIFRFDLSRISSRLDDSSKTFVVLEEGENFALVNATRRYDLDLLIKTTVAGQVSIGHYRIVLEKGLITKLIECTKFRPINVLKNTQSKASEDE
jgi:hypothetical protein